MAQDTILGREEELAAIASFIHGDRPGPHALLLEGEAGIGKTTLWRGGLRLAEARGVSCSRPGRPRRKLGSHSRSSAICSRRRLEATLEKLPTGQRNALEAALLLGPLTGSSSDARAVSLAVLGVLRSLATVGPVTIAIDDAQWTDTPSARVLAFALRRIDDEPISVLAATRVAPGLADPLDLAGLTSAGSAHARSDRPGPTGASACGAPWPPVRPSRS